MIGINSTQEIAKFGHAARADFWLITKTIIAFVLLGLTAVIARASDPEVYKDYSGKSESELIILHQNGDNHATFTLGYDGLFDHAAQPKAIPQGVVESMSYLEQAHNSGHGDAHSALSIIYKFGLFEVPEDFEKANNYSLEGAKRGSVVGKVNYGVDNVMSPNADIAKTAHDFLFEVAADDNVGAAANETLAKLYYFGSDVYEADYENARPFAESCVTFGRSEGRCEFLLARDFENGWGGPKDSDRSAKLFEVSAQNGNVRSMWKTGMNYLNGVGLEKDEVQAFAWVKKSANAGYTDGFISLAVMHALGQGTKVDSKAAFETYERAASLNSFHAVRGLSTMYCSGEAETRNDTLCAAGLIIAYEKDDDMAGPLLNKFFEITSNEELDVLRNKTAAGRATLIARYDLKL